MHTHPICLPQADEDALEAISALTGTAVSDLIRRAVSELIDSYLSTPEHPEIGARAGEIRRAVDVLRGRVPQHKGAGPD